VQLHFTPRRSSGTLQRAGQGLPAPQGIMNVALGGTSDGNMPLDGRCFTLPEMVRPAIAVGIPGLAPFSSDVPSCCPSCTNLSTQRIGRRLEALRDVQIMLRIMGEGQPLG
jgi:hypothetical protein